MASRYPTREVEGANAVRVLTRPPVAVDRVAISPNGFYVAGAGGMERLVLVWLIGDPAQPTLLLPGEWSSERQWHFCFEPGSGLLLVGDVRGVTAYDPAANPPYVCWRIPASSTDCMMCGLDVSLDGRELLAVYLGYDADFYQIQRWALNGRQPPTRQRGARWRDEGGVCGVAFLPGTASFIVAEVECVGAELVDKVHFRYDMQGRLQIVNAGGRIMRMIETELESIHQLAVSSDGRFVAAQNSQAVFVWNAQDFDTPPKKLKTNNNPLTGLAFCPSGRTLAVSGGTEVLLYDTSTWNTTKSFTWDGKPIRSVCFRSDGGLLAAGSDASEVAIWDLPKRRTRRCT